MASVRATEWHKLPVSLAELCIDTSLRCGQSFRWRKSGDDEWSCALRGRILSVRQDATHLHYRATYLPGPRAPLTPPSSTTSRTSSRGHDDRDQDTADLVREYFNLKPRLVQLYEQWSSADANFKKKAPAFTGIRVLQQDPWETLVGFICSSNNNIARISQMVEKLCLHYGPLVGYLGDQAYHDVPAPAALTGSNVESHLRQLGFGYRAKYLHQTAITIAKERPSGWLDGMQNPMRGALTEWALSSEDLPVGGREGYRAAHQQISELAGVGPKVADCVCLMGLGWGEAVPVDTHVWQIAQRDYKFGRGKYRTLTRATYDAVADHFRQLWGDEAGWAHSVLFTADLRAFSTRARPGVASDESIKQAAADRDEGSTVKMEAQESVITVEQNTRTGRGRKRKIESISTSTTTTTKTETSVLEAESVTRTLRSQRKRAR